MTITEIKNKLKSKEYLFLSEDSHLGSNVILLTLGGSHAYGTDTSESDIDIRGCALNSKRQILTNENFEQFINNETDTVIYSFNKLVSLLTNCNPNTIELIGNKPEHYFYVSPIGQELLDNVDLFLTQKAAYSFGGYANAQLRRLENKANRLVNQSRLEEYILNTIKHVADNFDERYGIPAGTLKLYIDKSECEDMDTEIFMDVVLKHYPVRDYLGMWEELKGIIQSYNKIGARNSKAIEHGKIGKHMMHLIRLYMMSIDILEGRGVITYREAEHDLLMDIRNGKFLDSNSQPTADFYDLVNEYDKKFQFAKENTALPKSPDYKAINDFVESVNERVVKGSV